jgi:hypothetical protein
MPDMEGDKSINVLVSPNAYVGRISNDGVGFSSILERQECPE